MGLAGLYQSLIQGEIRRREKVEEDKQKLLLDADMMDKLVAGITQGMTPVTKYKKAGEAGRVAGLDAKIDSDHPMKGFAPEFRQHLTSALADPRNRGFTAGELATSLTDLMLNQQDKEGQPRWARAYGQHRLETSGMGIPFVDLSPTPAPPSFPQGIMKYEDWHQRQRAWEDKRREEDPGMGFAASVGLAAGAGAGIGAIFGGPVGATGGGIAGAVGETVAYPLRKWLEKTEWARAKESHGGLGEKAKVWGVGLLPDVVAGVTAEGVFRRMALAGRHAATVAETARLVPTADNILARKEIFSAKGGIAPTESSLKETRFFGMSKEEATSWKKFWNRFVSNSAPEEVTMTAAQRAQELAKMQYERKMFVGALTNIRNKAVAQQELDDIALREVFNSRLPVPVAAREAAEGQIARGVALGRIDPTATIRQPPKLLPAPTKQINDMTMANWMEAGENLAKEELGNLYRINDQDWFKAVGGGKAARLLPDNQWRFDKAGRVVVGNAGVDAARGVMQDLVNVSVVAENVADAAITRGMPQVGEALRPLIDQADWLTERIGKTPPGAELRNLMYQADNIMSEITSKANSFVLVDSRNLTPGTMNQILNSSIEEAMRITAESQKLAKMPIVRDITDRIVSATERKSSVLFDDISVREIDESIEDISSFRREVLERQLGITNPEDYPKLAQEVLGQMSRKEINPEEGFAVLDSLYEQARHLDVDPLIKEAIVGPINDIKAAFNKGLRQMNDAAKKVELPKGYTIQEAVPDIAKAKMDVTTAGVKNFARKILDGAANGELGPDQAIEAFRRLGSEVAELNIDRVTKKELHGGIDQAITHFSKQLSLYSFLAVLGGAAAFEHFSATDANAGLVSTMGKAFGELTRKGTKAALSTRDTLVKQAHALHAARYVVPGVESDTKFLLNADEFQRGLVETDKGGAKAILKSSMNKWIKAPRMKFRYKGYGPGSIANQVFDLKEGVMNNPVIYKVSYWMAEMRNVDNANKVVNNILRYAGIRSYPKEVSRRFEPLIPNAEKAWQLEYYTEKAELVKQELKALANKAAKKGEGAEAYAADLEMAQKKLRRVENRMATLKPQVDEFHAEWARVAEQAATDLPSVKLTLALDDTADFQKYPFLRRIGFTKEELEAVGHLRRQFEVYRGRLEAAGVKTKKGPYVHYAMHPKANAERFVEAIDDYAAGEAFTKFYSRGRYSRLMMPDLPTTMSRYIADTERRLQNKAFWDSGWRKVRLETSHIQPVAEIFRLLDEGQRPIEQTMSNRAANFYVQLEVFKRLFLNPSAGLKHLVKASADVSGVGFKESFGSLDYALRNTGWRIMDTPTVRGQLTRMGMRNISDQDKLLRNTFNSMIPARTVHQRLLDMGIHVKEEYFSKFSELVHKTANAGGVWINLAEIFDRGMSVTAALRIAEKKGLTVDQAYYGALDLILKNNFLSREFNPEWLRSPKLRALLLFQATPWKILERRLVAGSRSLRGLGKLGEDVWKMAKTPEGRQTLLKDLYNMKAYMKDAERELKSNVFIDALRSEQDFFGTNVITQMARDIAITGAAIIGGASAGMNLTHHFFHIPFLRGYTSEPGVAFSPGIAATFRGFNEYKQRDDTDDEFLFKTIMDKWLGSTTAHKIFPDTFHKVARLSANDIPEIYQGSHLKYLFALPSADVEH